MSKKYITHATKGNEKTPEKRTKLLRYDQLQDDPWLIDLSESDRKFYEAILRTSGKLTAFSLNGYLFKFEGERP